jgi:hypothetical protein
VILFAGVVVFSACKKTTEKLRQLTSFTVVNATTDITTAKAYAADHEIAWSTLPTTENVLQYASNHYTALAGAILVKTVNAADTTKVLFASTGKTEVLEEAKLSTLFLAGNTTAGYEGILLKNEDLPLYSDSVMGIRYINLVPGSTGLNVTLSTSTTVNEAANLNYKQITDFKTYPALQSTAAITFQVRDAANVLLGSFILPYTPPGSGNYRTSAIPFARFKNLTLVIKGAIGGTGANVIGIFPVPHY